MRTLARLVLVALTLVACNPNRNPAPTPEQLSGLTKVDDYTLQVLLTKRAGYV